MPSTSETIDLVAIVERQDTGNAWQPHAWRALACRSARAIDPLGADAASGRTLIVQGALTLHRSEAENYLFNLSGGSAPAIYVILTKPASAEDVPALFALTCDPYEAQSFTMTNDMIVEAVPMPGEVEAWVKGFVGAHYKEEVFVKRKRKSHKTGSEDGHGEG
jgi:hypothetical protein